MVQTAVRATLLLAMLSVAACGGSGSGGDSDAGEATEDGGGTDGGASADGGNGTDHCPGYEPPSEGTTTCTSNGSDCDGIGSCYAPGSSCCPTSEQAPRECEDASECDDGDVCEPYRATEPCTSGTGTRCAPDCRIEAERCDEGSACDDDSGQCEPLSCPEDWTCPQNFDCMPGAADADEHGCARRACSSADDCDCGACVLDKCHDGPGACRPDCACASPDTPIATPDGERPIAELQIGDRVYSAEGDGIVAVPIIRTNRVPVGADHRVARVHLADGRVFEMTPGHPTADGHLLGDVAPGDELGDVRVEKVEIVRYRHPHTYDILPASSTGSYFAAGALVGSTLAP